MNAAWLDVPYPTDVFAARNSNGVYFPREGEEGVAQRLFANTKPADSVPTDPLDAGEIGIVDLPTAEQFQLPIANLTTGVGKPVVGVNALSLLAGYNQMQTSPAGFHTEPAVPSDPYAYPLTKVDQAMVPKTLDPLRQGPADPRLPRLRRRRRPGEPAAGLRRAAVRIAAADAALHRRPPGADDDHHHAADRSRFPTVGRASTAAATPAVTTPAVEPPS